MKRELDPALNEWYGVKRYLGEIQEEWSLDGEVKILCFYTSSTERAPMKTSYGGTSGVGR